MYQVLSITTIKAWVRCNSVLLPQEIQFTNANGVWRTVTADMEDIHHHYLLPPEHRYAWISESCPLPTNLSPPFPRRHHLPHRRAKTQSISIKKWRISRISSEPGSWLAHWPSSCAERALRTSDEVNWVPKARAPPYSVCVGKPAFFIHRESFPVRCAYIHSWEWT